LGIWKGEFVGVGDEPFSDGGNWDWMRVFIQFSFDLDLRVEFLTGAVPQ
jgi:hypothetical protein